MIPINQIERIDKILDEYNESLSMHLRDELRGEFMQICDDLAEPTVRLPITPVLSPDADGNLRPDWDMNL